jgi:FkbM family methyltransferase
MMYSQCGQDAFLENTIFKGFKNGTFIDVGAHDGKSFNNTLFFEETHQWSGVNIEPIPDVYEKLKNTRPACHNINCAIDETCGTAEFVCSTGYSEMISGLKKHYDPRHEARLDREILVHKGSKELIKVQTKTLESICDEFKIKHVHYLSIDVEGAEFAVIKSINFDKVFIDVIQFENNYDDSSSQIINYLKTKGYDFLRKLDFDIFMIHEESNFLDKTI